MNIKIQNITRSLLEIKLDKKILTFEGEMFFHKNILGFVLYTSTRKFSHPYKKEDITPSTLKLILDEVKNEFQQKNRILEIVDDG